MVRSKASVCLSFCVITVGAIHVLQYVHQNVNNMWSSAVFQRKSTPLELRKLLVETKRHSVRHLDGSDSYTFDKAECLGRLSNQDMAMQKYSLLLVEYQKIHHSVTSHKGAMTRNQKERIYRGGIQTKSSKIEWKDQTGNDFSMPPLNPAQTETQQDVIHRVQNRDSVLCRERFSVGPYHVQISFSIEGGKQENASVIVEVSSRLYLPHTVLSFLALVEAEQYAGFKVVLSSTTLSVEENEAQRSAETQKTLAATLGFIESSTKFPCAKHAFGFVGYGPQFMIVLDSDRYQTLNDQSTCFGRVAHGLDSLQILQAEAKRGSIIQVAWSRILDL